MSPAAFLDWARANPRVFTALCYSAAGVLPVLTGVAAAMVDWWDGRTVRR